MTMSVTTPITPTVASDAGATAAVLVGQSATDGEFADALAGFLDGGPGAQNPGTGDATDSAPDGDTAQAVDATTAATQMLATASPLWAAVTAPAALPPTPVAGAVPDAQPIAPAGSLAAAAVAPLASVAAPVAVVAGADQPGQPAAGVAGDVAAEVASAALPTVAAAAGESPAAGSAPAGAAQPAHANVESMDARTAASALGLTLVAAEQSATDTGTGSGAGGSTGSTPVVDAGATSAPGEATPAVPAGPTATAPTSSTVAASAPAANAPRPVHVAHQFATQVATLAGAANGVHTMTIQITPDDLGPVQVQVTLTDGAVDMTVLTALEVGRDTIAQAAPDLRRYLEAAGLTCNNVEVDLSNDQSSWLTQPDAEQNFEERQPSNGREQAGTPSGDTDDSPTAAAATRSPSSTSSGVDLQM